jgi:zeaxanthin glucosyltransferase
MHIALVCPELHGHMNPMATLGQELVRRGHRVSLVGSPWAQSKSDACGFEFLPVGLPEHQSGEAQSKLDTLARMKGLAALRLTAQILQRATAIFLRDAPEHFRTRGVQGVIVDQVSPAGSALADVLKLPFVIVCNALAMHQEPGIPPGVLPWRYRTGFLGRLRNRVGNAVLKIAAGPINRTVTEFRKRHGMPSSKFSDTNVLGLAQIAQQPAFFDFPRQNLPTHVHYTGPWHGPQRDTETAPFPWDKLNGRPLIYASLGTIQNQLQRLFRAILDGCAPLNVQVVLSLGRKDATWNEPTPSNAIVVPFAPQLKLLERASLLITHAGLNTTLEGLARGLPMLCLPVTNDQPGVARRVEWLGLGEVLKPGQATAEKIRATVGKLLADGRYRTAAEKCRDQLKGNPGVVRAADIVEQSLRTGKRVER